MKIKTNYENKIYLYKREDCVTRSLDPKNDPSGQASWSEFDPAYSVNLQTSDRSCPQATRFLEKSLELHLHSSLCHLHTATFLCLSLHDIFSVHIVFDIITCWMNKC